jgi:uncharacterized protein (DUF2147 family)
MRVLIALFMFLIMYVSHADTDSQELDKSHEKIVGLWETTDDKTGEKRAIVALNIKNNILYGTIIDVRAQPKDTGICKKCPGNFKNKAIKGLKFLWGAHAKTRDLWIGGYILDPHNGKIYRLKLKQVGDKLFVRAYVGVSVLGRTQIWLKKRDN